MLFQFRHTDISVCQSTCCLAVAVTDFFFLASNKRITINSDNSLAVRVRATLLYIIESVVAPNGSSISAKAFYGIFLQDIRRIKEYAWGEVMLIAIHEALGKYKINLSRYNVKSPLGISRSMFTLTVSCFNFVESQLLNILYLFS